LDFFWKFSHLRLIEKDLDVSACHYSRTRAREHRQARAGRVLEGARVSRA
jgi:hypothetical protein